MTAATKVEKNTTVFHVPPHRFMIFGDLPCSPRTSISTCTYILSDITIHWCVEDACSCPLWAGALAPTEVDEGLSTSPQYHFAVCNEIM